MVQSGASLVTNPISQNANMTIAAEINGFLSDRPEEVLRFIEDINPVTIFLTGAAVLIGSPHFLYLVCWILGMGRRKITQVSQIPPTTTDSLNLLYKLNKKISFIKK